MSFNFALAYLPETNLNALGPAETTISFDEASSITTPQASAAQCGPHVLVVDPTLQILADPAISETPGATIVTLAGISDTYVLQSNGQQRRFRVLAEREVVEDEGAALEAETLFDELADPEDAHLALFCRIAGVGFEDLNGLEWSPVTAGMI